MELIDLEITVTDDDMEALERDLGRAMDEVPVLEYQALRRVLEEALKAYRKQKPLEKGNLVRPIGTSRFGKIVEIHEQWAWVLWDDQTDPHTVHLEAIERVRWR